ncbi:MAG: hypothetical protein JO006_19925 [Paucibacter sp.]|nr:hypothetical protein [Roseateles sp.]
MKSQTRMLLALTCAGLMSAAHAGSVKTSDDDVYKPTGKGVGELDAAATEAVHNGLTKSGGGGANGISYHGGPLITSVSGVNVYYIFYGSWTSNQQALLTSLMMGLGGTPIFNINTSYYDGSKRRVVNAVTLKGQANDNYSLGKSLSDANIQTIVANQIQAGALPSDTNGVYFVLTAPDVAETSGFGSQYCGWHTHGTIGGADIKYAFVGNATTIAPSGCGVNNPSPNGDGGIDGMASVIYHELSEASTDPDLNAWYDRRGQENADKCAWTFGTTFKTSNGATANNTFGGKNWLLQQNWVNASGGYCTLSY